MTTTTTKWRQDAALILIRLPISKLFNPKHILVELSNCREQLLLPLYQRLVFKAWTAQSRKSWRDSDDDCSTVSSWASTAVIPTVLSSSLLNSSSSSLVSGILLVQQLQSALLCSTQGCDIKNEKVKEKRRSKICWRDSEKRQLKKFTWPFPRKTTMLLFPRTSSSELLSRYTHLSTIVKSLTETSKNFISS